MGVPPAVFESATADVEDAADTARDEPPEADEDAVRVPPAASTPAVLLADPDASWVGVTRGEDPELVVPTAAPTPMKTTMTATGTQTRARVGRSSHA